VKPTRYVRQLTPTGATADAAAWLATVPAWGGVCVALAAGAVGDLPAAVRYLPLLASVLLFGLPHGAVDPFVLPRAFGRPASARSLAAVTLLYLVVGGGYALVWVVAPSLAAVAFVVLTWAHWGQGDIHALVALLDADHLRTRAQRVLAAVVRGGLPMLVPLFAFPERYRAVLSAFVALFGTEFAVTWPFDPRVRLGLGVAFAALTLWSLALGSRRAGDRGPWRVDAAETLLLWAFFLLVPPVFAVGVYFALWHSLRHVCRTVLHDSVGAGALAAGDVAGALRRFYREAAPLTALALAFVGLAVLLMPAAPTDPLTAIALYLVVIAVLTLPHVVVVSLLDRAEGVWTPAA